MLSGMGTIAAPWGFSEYVGCLMGAFESHTICREYLFALRMNALRDLGPPDWVVLWASVFVLSLVGPP